MSQPSEPSRERIGWHPMDPVSLVAGLVAIAVAMASLLRLDVSGAVVLPVLLVAAGVVGGLSALRRR